MKKIVFLFVFLVASIEAKTLVLCYHAFSYSPIVNTSISPVYFKKHLKEIKSEGYKIIDLQTALLNFLSGDTSHIPELLITADDGWNSFMKHAFPILKEENAKATLFIYPRAISRYNGFLSWSDIQEMIATGLIDVGSHGMSHTPLKREFVLRKLYYNWFVEGELLASKEIIEFHTGKPIYAIAYPMGYFSDELLEITKKLGYKLGFTSENPLTAKYKGRFAIPRYYITKNDTSIVWLLRKFKEKYKLVPEDKIQIATNNYSPTCSLSAIFPLIHQTDYDNVSFEQKGLFLFWGKIEIQTIVESTYVFEEQNKELWQ